MNMTQVTFADRCVFANQIEQQMEILSPKRLPLFRDRHRDVVINMMGEYHTLEKFKEAVVGHFEECLNWYCIKPTDKVAQTYRCIMRCIAQVTA
jgi:hypothetical protein